MDCQITWDMLGPDEWEARYAEVRRSNLLQSYDYARAVAPLNRQQARFGSIEIDGTLAGLVQILEAGILWRAVHGVVLDRGPLWFEGFGTPAHVEAFFRAFSHEFPARRGRKRRILPECSDAKDIHKRLSGAGLTPRSDAQYRTIWLDLQSPLDQLRAQLKQKWRNTLNKADRAGLEISWDWEGASLAWLLSRYTLDREARGYEGPSADLLIALATVLIPQKRLGIGRARRDGEDAGAVLVMCHGVSATYQIGWTNEIGRKAGAHHALLWDAIRELQSKGIRDFDLGGVSEDAAGVTAFKAGLGGEEVRLVGHYA